MGNAPVTVSGVGTSNPYFQGSLKLHWKNLVSLLYFSKLNQWLIIIDMLCDDFGLIDSLKSWVQPNTNDSTMLNVCDVTIYIAAIEYNPIQMIVWSYLNARVATPGVEQDHTQSYSHKYMITLYFTISIIRSLYNPINTPQIPPIAILGYVTAPYFIIVCHIL